MQLETNECVATYLLFIRYLLLEVQSYTRKNW
jgi:hypothetical protein